MTDRSKPTIPSADALSEPTEGHVEVDGATSAHRGGPGEPLEDRASSTMRTPSGTLPGAGLTDHDQPVEGGRDEAEDGGGG